LGHPSKFQRVSRFGFVTAATSFTGGQPTFARCLAVSWAGALYIHLRGRLPLAQFYQMQSSLCIQVLRFPILAVLLHGTRPVGVSQTLWHGTRNGIIWNFCRRSHLYSAGRPSCWASAHILVENKNFDWTNYRENVSCTYMCSFLSNKTIL